MNELQEKINDFIESNAYMIYKLASEAGELWKSLTISPPWLTMTIEIKSLSTIEEFLECNEELDEWWLS